MEILRRVQSKLFALTYYSAMFFGLAWIVSDRVVQGLSTILLAIIASELIKLRKATVPEDARP
ncbi:hypothetical protein [Calidithermus roseus]|uniref:Uncharacterized protein n=1 Tax=Calidithermus roseus TaxID=1644118 RepID=A0A399EJN5_9DEIN|nr:hypothetical protein [Calidithermus roseus]RIH84335.1 hypothetical protein Mrose_02684 [Calidithermus roseus]